MFRRVLVPFFFVALLTSVTPGWAQEPYPRGDYGSQVQPLDRILPNVRNGRPGRFYDAEGPFPDATGGYHYRIKWLTPEGRVIWLDADARSGRVLGVARGDWREQGPPAFGNPEGPRDRFGAPPGENYGAPPPPPPRGVYGAPPPPGPDRAFGRGPFGGPRGGFGNWRRGPGPGGRHGH